MHFKSSKKMRGSAVTLEEEEKAGCGAGKVEALIKGDDSSEDLKLKQKYSKVVIQADTCSTEAMHHDKETTGNSN